MLLKRRTGNGERGTGNGEGETLALSVTLLPILCFPLIQFQYPILRSRSQFPALRYSNTRFQMLTVYDKHVMLTPMMIGEMYFQHKRKYMFGRWPIMSCMSSANFSVPLKGQKKQTNYKINMKIFSWLSLVIRFFLFTA